MRRRRLQRRGVVKLLMTVLVQIPLKTENFQRVCEDVRLLIERS